MSCCCYQRGYVDNDWVTDGCFMDKQYFPLTYLTQFHTGTDILCAALRKTFRWVYLFLFTTRLHNQLMLTSSFGEKARFEPNARAFWRTHQGRLSHVLSELAVSKLWQQWIKNIPITKSFTHTAAVTTERGIHMHTERERQREGTIRNILDVLAPVRTNPLQGEEVFTNTS